MDDNSTKRLTYSVDEAAGLLGISHNAAYEAIKAGQIPHIRIGRRVLVSRAALHAMIEGVKQVSDTSNTPTIERIG